MTTEEPTVRLLRADAPGLHAALGRLGDALAMERYELAYRASCANGGLDEGNIERTAGASFNPRPARICQILLQECKEKTPDTLCAALLISGAADPSYSQKLKDCAEIADQARQILQGARSEAPPAELVALAFHLDVLRHMHMGPVTKSDRQTIRERTAMLLAQCPPRDSSFRLKALIQAALDRFLTRDTTA